MGAIGNNLSFTQDMRGRVKVGLSELITYWRIVRKRWWLILILVATTVAAVVGFSLTKPSLYRASVRVQVTAAPPSDVTLYQGAKAGTFSEEVTLTRASFMEVIASLDVAWQVVDTLKLPMTGKQLLQKITVEDFPTSSLVRVSAVAEDPQQVTDIANAFVQAALQQYGQLNAYPLTLSREFIKDQLEQTQEELQQAQTELIRFQIENRIATLDDTITTLQNLIRSLELAHDEALAVGNTSAAENYDALVSARLRELQNIVQLKNQYDTLDSRVRQLQETYNFLLEKETEARLKENEALNLSFIQVLGQARVPTDPEPRLSPKVLVLAGIVSLALGVMLAFLTEYIGSMDLEGTKDTTAALPGAVTNPGQNEQGKAQSI